MLFSIALNIIIKQITLKFLPSFHGFKLPSERFNAIGIAFIVYGIFLFLFFLLLFRSASRQQASIAKHKRKICAVTPMMAEIFRAFVDRRDQSAVCASESVLPSQGPELAISIERLLNQHGCRQGKEAAHVTVCVCVELHKGAIIVP